MIRSRLAERRRFLKLVGATALTYPFLRSTPSFAGTSSSGPPVFLVLLFTSCGVVRYLWGAQGNAPTSCTPPTTGADATTTPLVFRATLAPFANATPLDGSAAVNLSKYVTVLDGLNNAAANGGTHEAGFASLWTGSLIANNANTATTGPSVDQAIAAALVAQGITSPFQTLPFYAQSSADYVQASVDTRMLYTAGGGWVAPISSGITQASLQLALNSVFPPSVKAGPNPTPAIRAAVANDLNSELKALQGRLCKEDATQIGQLQSMWNQTYTDIAAASLAAAKCTTPVLASGYPALPADPYPYNVTAMSNILAMALACNLTRVASLQLSHALSPVTLSWLSTTAAPQNMTHHLFSHQGPSYLGQLGSELYGTTSNNGNQPFANMYNSGGPQLANIDYWYATQVASFAATLYKTANPFGSGTLLDQTVICWGSELDMGAAHNHDDTPFLLIGGGGGKVKTGGQLVGFPMNLGSPPYTFNGNRVNGSQNVYSPGNRFHNDLLLTLGEIMGVSLPMTGKSFGSAAANLTCSGPITEVLA
jgi:hypothetical protein